MKSDDVFRGPVTGQSVGDSPNSMSARFPGSADLRGTASNESRTSMDSQDYARIFAVADNATENGAYYSGTPKDQEYVRFQDRLRRGKVKLCPGCGGVMARSSRMILSPISGACLIIAGLVLMALYGLATNFYQPPWFMKFALPAAYYIGSIFIGVGVVFFFVREKVWCCPRCRDLCKR